MTTMQAEHPPQRTCDGPTCQVTSSFWWANVQWETLGINRGSSTDPDWELLFHSDQCVQEWRAANPTRWEQLGGA
jgi:hypothetical protein